MNQETRIIVFPNILAFINEQVEQRLIDKNINLIVSVETEEAKLKIDEGLLIQVLVNLISNAVKYTTKENAQLVINCKEFADHYEFSVKDNGIGIDPEYHDRIFEIFQTLREKDEKESTGIGLALIKRILDDQNCTIRVESTPGNGAEFIFTWPRNVN